MSLSYERGFVHKKLGIHRVGGIGRLCCDSRTRMETHKLVLSRSAEKRATNQRTKKKKHTRTHQPTSIFFGTLIDVHTHTYVSLSLSLSLYPNTHMKFPSPLPPMTDKQIHPRFTFRCWQDAHIHPSISTDLKVCCHHKQRSRNEENAAQGNRGVASPVHRIWIPAASRRPHDLSSSTKQQQQQQQQLGNKLQW